MRHDIICGVDLPNASKAAAQTAATLARELDGRAVLVHVMGPPSRPPEGGLPSLRRARHLGRLRAIVEELALPHGTTVDILAGDPADELLTAAEERDAELIVLGAGGLRELGSGQRGGVSSVLMRAAPCPVVVVPPHAIVPSDIRAVVCGVEGSRTDVDLLRLAGDLARRSDATVRAVHSFARRATPPTPGTATPFGTQALIRAAEEDRAGLIAVASQGQGRLDPILLSSLSVQLAARAPVPVVVLPPRAELSAGSGHYELATEAA